MHAWLIIEKAREVYPLEKCKRTIYPIETAKYNPFIRLLREYRNVLFKGSCKILACHFCAM